MRLLAFALALVLAVAPRARGQTAAQIAGCYSVSVGIWSPAIGRDSVEHTIPSAVRLDTVQAADGDGLRLSPAISRRAAREARHWSMGGGDVRLLWSEGATSTLVTLQHIPDGRLVGGAVAETERPSTARGRALPRPKAPVVLEPTACGRRMNSTQPSSTSAANERARTLQRWQPDLNISRRVAGCYEIVNDGWQADSAMASIEPIPQRPIRFELTDVPDTNVISGAAYDETTYFEARMIAGSPGLFSTWSRLSDTDPIISVSNFLPMGGYELRVSLRGTNLVGTIAVFTDVAPQSGVGEASHAVTARRIACGSTRRPPRTGH